MIDTKEIDEIASDGLSDTVPSDEDSPWEVSSDSEDGLIIERQSRNSAPSTSRTSNSAGMPIASDLDPSAALDMVNHIISCLWKLPIRRPAPLDRMKETSTADTSYYQPFDVQHVKNKFPMVDESVASRLGKMISRRRQGLRYRESHMDSLSKTRTVTMRQVADAKFDEEVVDVENIEPAPSYAASTHHTYSTHATTLKIDGNERPHTTWNLDAPSVTMTVSSVGSDLDNDSPLAIPKRPKGDDGATLEQFICPYCHTMQTIRTDRSWRCVQTSTTSDMKLICSRKHILLDLQPYVCTYVECALGEQTFQDQEEWYQHEVQNHRYQWFCNVEGHDTFETVDSFIEHMKSSHHQDFRKDELHALQHTFRRAASTQSGVCPLCFETTQKIKSHVARHLKQLALFAIPQTDFMALSDTDGEGGSNKANRSDQAIQSPQRSSPASDDSSVSSSQNIKKQDSEAVDLPEEDTDPLVFDDAQTSSLPGSTAQDTSWDYVTPKFRDARRQDETDHQVQSIDSNQGSATEFPVPILNLIQSTPPGSDADPTETMSRPSSPPIQYEGGENEGRRGSRVSWSENQLHDYEVQTPDSYREQFTPTSEMHGNTNQSGTDNNDPSVKSEKLESGDEEIHPDHDLQTNQSLAHDSIDREDDQAAGPTETIQKGESHGGITDAAHDGGLAVMNPYHQQRPICGASIGAFRGASIGAFRGEHLPPVSLGGIILVDGEPYGLTVHHMLDVPSDDESEADDQEQDSKDIPKAGQSSTENPEVKQSLNAEPSAFPSTSDINPWAANNTDPNYLTSPNDPIEPPQDLFSTKSQSSLPSQSPQSAEHHIPNQVAEASSNSKASQLSRDPAAPDKARSDTVTPWDLDMVHDSDTDHSDEVPSDGLHYDESLTDDEFSEGSEQNLAYDSGVHFTGDIPGIAPGEGKDIIITQPAIDDVDDDFFPNEETAEIDHLDKHRLGYLHASSGIRRVKRNGVLHEVDWALIKIDPDRLQLYNVVQGGRRFSFKPGSQDPPPLVEPIHRHYLPEEDEYPMDVAPADSLSGMSVHSFGRTTGLQGGMIGTSMAQVKIYRRTSYSRSWYVSGGCKSTSQYIHFRF